MRDYKVFGLRVRSEIHLPELFGADEGHDPDVTITFGQVPEVDKDVWPAQVNGAIVLSIDGTARYEVRGGERIIIDPADGAPDRNVRLFLLGSAFGALLLQRGLLPLHANAVEIGGKAFVFMGASGEGKSTLAAWLHDRGYKIIADDVCVICFHEDRKPYAAPGLPRLRLWAEAVERSGRVTTGYERSYVGEEGSYDKFDVPITPDRASNSHVPVAALYVLGRSDSFSVGAVDGLDAAEAVIANTYRGAFVAAANAQQVHWSAAIQLVRSIPVYRLDRHWSASKIDEQYDGLLGHVLQQLKGEAT